MGIELIAVGAAEVELDQPVDPRFVVDLVAVERRLQVVQLVGIGLLG